MAKEPFVLDNTGEAGPWTDPILLINQFLTNFPFNFPNTGNAVDKTRNVIAFYLCVKGTFPMMMAEWIWDIVEQSGVQTQE